MSATDFLGLAGGVAGSSLGVGSAMGLAGGGGGIGGIPPITTTATAGDIKSGDLIPSNFVGGATGGSRGIVNNFGDGSHSAAGSDLNSPKVTDKTTIIFIGVIAIAGLIVVKLLR